MRSFFQISFLAVFILIFFNQNIDACDYNIPPLRKQFRDSKNVFIGEIIEISDTPQNLKNSKERAVGGIVKFRIQKSWKGTKDKEISLLSDLILMPCDGNPFEYFKKGEKYLIFSEKDYAAYILSTKLEFAADKIKRLDDFWFRIWARIYPF